MPLSAVWSGQVDMMKLLLNYFDKKDYAGQIMVNGQAVSQLASDGLYQKIAFIQKNDFYRGKCGGQYRAIQRYKCTWPNFLVPKSAFNEAFLKQSWTWQEFPMANSGLIWRASWSRIMMCWFLMSRLAIFDPNLAAESWTISCRLKTTHCYRYYHNQGRALLDALMTVWV